MNRRLLFTIHVFLHVYINKRNHDKLTVLIHMLESTVYIFIYPGCMCLYNTLFHDFTKNKIIIMKGYWGI